MMESMQHLIPKNKFDIETAEQLNEYSIDEILVVVSCGK